jgi:hypothetical protein
MLTLLIIFMLIYAMCDAAMDGIKDIRTHLGLHPYKDFWHACKHLSRVCLIGLGMITVHVQDKIVFLIVFVVTCIISLAVWEFVYDTANLYAFKWDESLHISTGWKWLDKKLGFHW